MARPPAAQKKVRLPRIGRGKVTVAEFVGGQMALRPQLDTDAVVLHYRAIGGLINDLQPVLTLYAYYLVNTHIPKQFETQGAWGGKKWAKLKPKYAAWKLKNYGRLPILVLTGKMRDSFKYTVGKRSMRIVNRRKYWGYHQYGTRNMPARPLIVITAKDRKVLQGATQSYLTEAGAMWEIDL
jgi:phage gpG-like protein